MGLFSASLQMSCNLIAVGIRAKQGDVWDSVVLVTYIGGTLEPAAFKIIAVLFGALVSKSP